MRTIKDRKVVLVGTGSVGMSMAYTLLMANGIDELVLIDVNEGKAKGEAMDLSHGLPYAPNSKMVIKSGGYEECKDANIIVVTAGANQKPGQSRLELTAINTRIMKEICEDIKASGFNGVLVIASNPVDVLTCVAQEVTGLPHNQVFGSGTSLDSARLRFLMSDYLGINPRSIHAYILGEHGDSSFVSWTNCYVGAKSLLDYIDEKGKDFNDLLDIYKEVRDAAYEVIELKGVTNYGIGLSLNKIVLAILNNEDVVIPVSAYQNGEYGQKGLYIGVPAIICRKGVREVIKLPLNEVDQGKFDKSCESLKKVFTETALPVIQEA